MNIHVVVYFDDETRKDNRRVSEWYFRDTQYFPLDLYIN